MSAIFNSDRTHRYLLSRGDETKPYILFIGLNPSDAAEEAEDPTTNRLNTFSALWGFEHWKIANLSPYVSSDPSVLRYRQGTTDRMDNNHYLKLAIRGAELIVPCWGAGVSHLGFPASIERPAWVIATCAGKRLQCFGRTKDGHPKHPLYLRGDTLLQPWFEDLA